MEVIRDDMSRAGLRRLHLVDQRKIPLEDGLARVELEGGKLEEFASYEDDLGYWHLHVYWRRREMNMMQVCATYSGDHGGALQEAAGLYERRFGMLPNVAYVKDGVNGAEKVELRGQDGEVRGVVQVRRVKWMLTTDVGVTFEEV